MAGVAVTEGQRDTASKQPEEWLLATRTHLLRGDLGLFVSRHCMMGEQSNAHVIARYGKQDCRTEKAPQGGRGEERNIESGACHDEEQGQFAHPKDCRGRRTRLHMCGLCLRCRKMNVAFFFEKEKRKNGRKAAFFTDVKRLRCSFAFFLQKSNKKRKRFTCSVYSFSTLCMNGIGSFSSYFVVIVVVVVSLRRWKPCDIQ